MKKKKKYKKINALININIYKEFESNDFFLKNIVLIID